MEKKDWHQKDRKHLWHPYTQMKGWMNEDFPVIERGEGVYLIDTEGNRYIDGVSSLWCNIHGHAHPFMNQRIKEQLDRIGHSTQLGLGSIPAIQLAEKLVQLTDHLTADPQKKLTRVFYSDNGSSAVEIAAKMAFQYWHHKGEKGRTKFISFANSYHGDPVGAMSLGNSGIFHEVFKPLFFETFFAPYPYCYRCPMDKSADRCAMACLEETEKLIKAHSHETAALLIEPMVQGAAGMVTAPVGFLKEIRALCHRYNVLMIADEVAVGFGRTGTLFACEQEGIVPDLLCLAKGLTGGYLPLAVTMATEEIYGQFLGEYEDFKTFFHGHTYTGNQLGCATALATLEVFENEKTLEQLRPKISLMASLLEMFRNLPHVGEVRQRGFMVGIELVEDKPSKRGYEPKLRKGHQVTLIARSNGAIIRPIGNVVILMPPLSIGQDELERLIDITYRSIREATEES